MLMRNFMNNFKAFELSDPIVLMGWAAKQSNNPMANVGPKASKSPEATLTALHMDTHKRHMMKVYGKPLTSPAVWKMKNYIGTYVHIFSLKKCVLIGQKYHYWKHILKK